MFISAVLNDDTVSALSFEVVVALLVIAASRPENVPAVKPEFLISPVPVPPPPDITISEPS